jgi:hypothetical protein
MHMHVYTDIYACLYMNMSDYISTYNAGNSTNNRTQQQGGMCFQIYLYVLIKYICIYLYPCICNLTMSI